MCRSSSHGRLGETASNYITTLTWLTGPFKQSGQSIGPLKVTGSQSESYLISDPSLARAAFDAMYIRESEQHPPTNELESVKSKVDEGCSSEEGGGDALSQSF